MAERPVLGFQAGVSTRRIRVEWLFVAAAVSVVASLSSPSRAEPSAVAPSGGFVYTADEKGNSVSVIDLGARKVDIVAVPVAPHNVQISSDGRRLYVVGARTKAGEGHDHGGERGRLLVFDTSSMASGPVADIEVGAHPAHVVADRDGKYAFVTNSGDDTVSVVDLAQRRVVKNVKTGAYPHGLRMSADGREIYVANVNGGSVSVIDVATLTAAATIAVGKEPIQVGFAAEGRRVYVSLRAEDSVAVVDTAARRVLTKVRVGRGPVQVFATPDGRYVFVANQGDAMPGDTVSVIDTATHRVVKTIVTGKGVHGVVVSDDGRWAFVTNIGANSVSVIDTRALAVVAAFAVGRGPNGITYRSGISAPRN
jgi:YVTN family beta-propeller protein